MILFNTTVIISNSVEEEWLRWIKEVHIPAAMATGLPASTRLLRLVSDVHEEGTTYTCQYFFDSMEKLEEYATGHQAELDEKHHARYKDRYFSFQTVLEEV